MTQDVRSYPAGGFEAGGLPARGGALANEIHPRHVGRRLVELGVVVGAIAVLVLTGPGLGGVRSRIAHASVGLLLAAMAAELLSGLSYVVIFRTVFCRRMSLRLSYHIAIAEEGANSVLSVSGAGGLALGAWALRRAGMSTEHIARRTVAFFFLTSMANVGGVILFALLCAVGVLGRDRDPTLTYGFGVAALIATAIVLALPSLLSGTRTSTATRECSPRLGRALQFVRYTLAQGVRDGLLLLRHRPVGVLVGSIGYVGFDLVVLGLCFLAFGYSPPLGPLVLGYLIGQLGGNIPLPGGIGGVDAGLIGVLVLYHQPLAVTTAAVLIYHFTALWLPALLGSISFVRLRRILADQPRPGAICSPLAEPLEIAPVAVEAATSS